MVVYVPEYSHMGQYVYEGDVWEFHNDSTIYLYHLYFWERVKGIGP